MEETEIMCGVYMKLHHHHEQPYDPPTTPSANAVSLNTHTVVKHSHMHVDTHLCFASAV